MPYFSKTQLIETLNQLGIRLQKKSGQCYLIDRNIQSFIINEAQLDPTRDIVLEIGSGLGLLSDDLIKRSKRVYLVDFDSKICDYLKKHFEKLYSEKFQFLNAQQKIDKDFWKHSLSNEKVKAYLVQNDILKIPWPNTTKIVSNIPYQISAPLLFKMIENWSYEKVILMVQEEFADRLVAPTNSKQYSRLSAAAGLFLEVTKIKQVPGNCFFPQPNVSSAIISIEAKEVLNPESKEFKYRKDYLAFLRGIFPFKNKNLRGAIKQAFKNDASLSGQLYHLKNLITNSETHPILTEKVRSLSSKRLFSLVKFGIEGGNPHFSD